MESQPEDTTCLICVEEFTLFGLGSCNHTQTCSVCHYKQRVILQKIECNFCQNPNDAIIITDDPDAKFEDFSPEGCLSYPMGNIYFPTEEIQEEFESQIGLKCPFEQCSNRKFQSKIVLKNHLKKEHKRYFW